MTLLSSCVVIILIALSAVRYIDRPRAYVERVYTPADFSQPLHAAQRILIGEKLDINAASEEELQVLSGVGPKLAARIVADRERNGPFPSVASITRVYGIGPKTLQKNRHFLKAY